jgi:threonine dehydrogenase-like Zn-dependent dehydrogenase
MGDRIVAAVQTGPRAIELQEFPRPRIGDDDALLRVEACGICGSDVEQYRGGMATPRYPVIPGHEPVGVVEEIGPTAAARRGLRAGDRVAVDPAIPCGSCRHCMSGQHMLCTGWGRARTYGFGLTSEPPGLWGGYATHLYLHPNTILYPIPDHVGPELAVLYNPLGAGVSWGVLAGGVTVGSSVVILGCGQRGLACAIAARAAGAKLVVVTGLARDAHKLELARQLGVDAAIDIERDAVVGIVADLTDGSGVDAAVDTTPGAVRAVHDAVDLVRPGGTIVLGGLKGRGVPDFPFDRIALAGVTIRGMRGVPSNAYLGAISLIASGRFPLDRLRTHTFPLDAAGRAVEVLAGEVPSERAVNVVIRP